jgi:peptidyl-tRNA hydrolase, PTH1 family
MRAEIADCRRGERRIFLMAPLTYMNLSGEAVRPFCDYYEIPPTNLTVICDDHDLPWGRMRLRAGGGTAGHKGLKSIESQMGTDRFTRLRIGIRPAHPRKGLVDYVLAPFHEEGLDLFGHMVAIAADAIETRLAEGLQQAMNRFNGVNLAEKNE